MALLVRVQDQVRAIQELLGSPDAPVLDQCASRLEAAVADMVRLKELLPAGGLSGEAGLLASALELQKEIVHLKVLLDSPAAFYSRWTQLLRGLTGGYTAGGQPVPGSREPRCLTEA